MEYLLIINFNHISKKEYYHFIQNNHLLKIMTNLLQELKKYNKSLITETISDEIMGI